MSFRAQRKRERKAQKKAKLQEINAAALRQFDFTKLGEVDEVDSCDSSVIGSAQSKTESRKWKRTEE